MKQPVSYHPTFAHGIVAVLSDGVAVEEVEEVLGAVVFVIGDGSALLAKAITAVDTSSSELETALRTPEIRCS